MAFLAPLFLLGLAALALPVLLHLRRNRPQQTVPFSTLMFLEKSPPVARRSSKLQNVFLLLLRCLALALLILAFTRPFIPASPEKPALSTGSRLQFILIDNSASMTGEPLEHALVIAEKLIDDAPDSDAIAVATFANGLAPLLPPAQARELEESGRKTTAKGALETIEIKAEGTRLDGALLAAVAAAGGNEPVTIHLVGDLQKGSSIESLRDEPWPDFVQITLHPVARDGDWTNAGVEIIRDRKGGRRLRVSNAAGSAESSFSLAWSGREETVKVTVAPGESGLFEFPDDVSGEGKVVLTGDDFSFDNTATWSQRNLPIARVWTPDPAATNSREDSLYFLQRALGSTNRYEIIFLTDEANGEEVSLAFSEGAEETESFEALRKTLASGGTALLTLPDAASSQALYRLLDVTAGEATEAQVDDHARFGEIDFSSRPFAPFADARYSDFSTIRIWHYRILPDDIVARARVDARFDCGDPAWLEYPVGKGTLHVLTTIWRPSDSQLALTTKFPPLLHSLLSLPSSEEVEAEGLSARESELTPLTFAELDGLGLPMASVAADEVAGSENLSPLELERRQRFGWWLLVAAAAVFLLETSWSAFAGDRRSPAPA